MSAPFFFDSSHGLTLGKIAEIAGTEPGRDTDRDRLITGIAPLDRAGPRDLCFFDSSKYVDQARATDAGACLTSARLTPLLPASVSVLCVAAPYSAFVEVARVMFPDAQRPSSLFEVAGVAPGAFVHPTARLESGVRIDPAVVIGPRAEIGAGTVIAAGAVIGPDVRIGRDCAIGSHASIIHALIGDRVIIHPGARIGQDGFGFLPRPQGHRKIPQVGRVIVQDDVEIGANSTIDRGFIRDTVIGEGTKVDNLVQIAHNVTVGRHCLVAGAVGISGSVTIGDDVMIGGGAGIADNVTVGEGARILAACGVMSDIPPGTQWMGSPARPTRTFFRELAVLKRLAEQSRVARPPNPSHDTSATDDPA